MFAVVKTGGKQYKVQVGETIDVEKLAFDKGAQVRLDEVLLAADGGNVAYGRPIIDGAVVTARVVRQHKGPKLIVFKYKSKSRYRRRTGHRQQLTQLYVQTIDVPGLGTDTVAAARARTTTAATEEPQAVPSAVASAPTAEPVASPATPSETVASPATPSETVASPASPAETPVGSAAPADDVLPVAAPTAQLDAADTRMTAGQPETLGDTTLPTSTLPADTTATTDLEPPAGSSETERS